MRIKKEQDKLRRLKKGIILDSYDSKLHSATDFLVLLKPTDVKNVFSLGLLVEIFARKLKLDMMLSLSILILQILV